MPRQNRVTPFGDLMAIPDRGTFMGNRGLLHEAGHIKRAWQVKRWIICVLAFKGWKRQIMRPGHYTELFFLDEATALAAGHRPCAACRRERFNAYRQTWQPALPTADEIDDRLHAQRVAPDRSKRCFLARLEELPNGVFVRHAEWGASAYLVWNDELLAWSAGGYTRRLTRPNHTEVQVLTPESTVAALQAGYVPQLHPSAIRP